jgi:hypothetical protein
VVVVGDPVDGAGHLRGIAAAGDGLVPVRRRHVGGRSRSAQNPGPHEREQQQCRKQRCPYRGGGPADDDLGGRAGRGDASMGTRPGAGLPELRHRLQVLHDLLVEFGVGQDRQQLGRPPPHAVVAPVLAGTALAQVAGQGQPQGIWQHYRMAPTVPIRVAIFAASVSQDLS